SGDAYRSLDLPPLGLVGLDPTRTIEVWAYNPTIAAEETLVSWGRRGGGAGTNMSFNYGSNELFGAVGHWDFPDLGWGPVVPREGAWQDRKSTRLNSSHVKRSYAVCCLKKKKR